MIDTAMDVLPQQDSILMDKYRLEKIKRCNHEELKARSPMRLFALWSYGNTIWEHHATTLATKIKRAFLMEEHYLTWALPMRYFIVVLL